MITSKHGIFLIISGLFNCHLLISQQSEKHDNNRFGGSIPEGFNTLMLSIDYASNTNVLGNFNAETKQPSFSPSLVFFSKYNFDLSVLGYFVDNSDDSLEQYTSEVDLVMGYTFKPFNNFSIYPSYSHYFHSNNSNSLKSIFSNDIRIDIDYNYSFIDLGVSAGYFFGKRQTFYASAHNYYQLDFNQVIFRNDHLSLQPGIDAYFSNYEYLNLYYLDEIRKDPDFYNYLRTYPVIRKYIYFEKLRNPGLTYTEILDRFLEEKAEDNFKLALVSVNFPLYYTIGDFIINLGLYLFLPINQPDYLVDNTKFFFDIGLSYCLTLNK